MSEEIPRASSRLQWSNVYEKTSEKGAIMTSNPMASVTGKASRLAPRSSRKITRQNEEDVGVNILSPLPLAKINNNPVLSQPSQAQQQKLQQILQQQQQQLLQLQLQLQQEHQLQEKQMSEQVDVEAQELESDDEDCIENIRFDSTTYDAQGYSSNPSPSKLDGKFQTPTPATKVKVDVSSPASSRMNDCSKFDILFDTPDHYFDTYRFFKHFVINFIGHPIVLLAPRWSNYTAQGLGEIKTSGDFFFSLTNFILVAFAFIAVLLGLAAPDSVQNALGGTCYMVLLYYTIHRLNVAMKYATLSPTEYAKLMNTADGESARHYQDQIQMVSSIGIRSEALINFEVLSLSMQYGVDVSKITFTVANPSSSHAAAREFLNWQAFLLGRKNLSGLSTTEVHSDLEGIMVPASSGGTYRGT